MALPSAGLGFRPAVIVDYVSPHGSTVTDVRAIVLQGALSLLEAGGYLQEYQGRVPATHMATLRQAVASSWIPVEMLVTYYATLDDMQMSDNQIASIAGPLGARLFDSLFGTIVRAVRGAGVENGVWIGLKQTDRIYSRVYHGGSCRVTQVGPKDAVLDIVGLPGVNARCSRLAHCAFLRSVLRITTRACVVKVQGGVHAAGDRLALAISWV